MTQQAERTRRTPLSRDRVLNAAVALADEVGIEALSMRRLAQELGVVPMALYKHVANKEELLDGMVDALVSEIDPPSPVQAGRTPYGCGCSRHAGAPAASLGPPGAGIPHQQDAGGPWLHGLVHRACSWPAASPST